MDSEKIWTEDEFEFVIREITARGCKRVGLQLPDDMLCSALMISERLGASCSAEFFVLADTSYGSCCVDQTAAEHVQAELVVHFGYSCLSQPCRLSALLVFGKEHINLEHLISSFSSVSPLPSLILVLAEPKYQWCLEILSRELESLGSNVEIAEIETEFNPYSLPKPTGFCFMNRHVECKADGLFVVADDSLFLSTLIMTSPTVFPDASVHVYSPRSCSFVIQKESRFLMKRYALIEKAVGARFVGILVGTLGVEKYLTVANELKSMLRNAGKRSYTFSMGKLNVAKLANFLEIDLFVLVACPENSVLDSKEFLRPVITPYEMMLSLENDSSRLFSRGWSTSFPFFLNERKIGVERDDVLLEKNEEEQAPRLSLASGRLCGFKERKQMLLIEYEKDDLGAAERFNSRAFQGLIPSDKIEFHEVIHGAKGTARRYAGEDLH